MSNQAHTIEITPELLAKYDRPGPRYTSYPTAPEWREDFTGVEYRLALEKAANRPDDPLSLYVHIPFCYERCAFCGCNVIIGGKEGVENKYLDYVDKELGLVSQILHRRHLKQLHWGGGTPTFLDAEQMTRLFDAIAGRFIIDSDAEVAIEVDPRVTTRDHVQTLQKLGFNRISMGVQDLDPEVQCAIHRFQTEEQTSNMFDLSREAGIQSINVDLVYGLPGQRADTWWRTITRIIELRPERIATYSYAHLPDKLRNQKHIDEALLPRGADKYELFAIARRLFLSAGYRPIGMDHFAAPEDELSLAIEQRRLRRNFMGYTVAPATEALALGISAISEIGGVYAQNEKKLSTYYAALDAGRLPTLAGCVLMEDDRIRAWMIQQLMCNFYVDVEELSRRFGIEYEQYFTAEEDALAEYYDQRFLTKDGRNLTVLPLGQAFIRNLAMVFDTYLRQPTAHRNFSRTV